jgi:hypothetical protein
LVHFGLLYLLEADALPWIDLNLPGLTVAADWKRFTTMWEKLFSGRKTIANCLEKLIQNENLWPSKYTYYHAKLPT